MTAGRTKREARMKLRETKDNMIIEYNRGPNVELSSQNTEAVI
jgi:hypothetical protein